MQTMKTCTLGVDVGMFLPRIAGERSTAQTAARFIDGASPGTRLRKYL